jgi:hypothetical protein
MAEESGNKAEQTAYLQQLLKAKHCAQSNESIISADKLIGD